MVAKFGIRELGEATLSQLDQIAGELDPMILKRIRHIIRENARVRDAADALQSGDAARMERSCSKVTPACGTIMRSHAKRWTSWLMPPPNCMDVSVHE
jgi:galactokinase